MIDSDNFLRCDGCRKKLAFNLQGRVEIPCPRCKRHNIFDSETLPRVWRGNKAVDQLVSLGGLDNT